MLGKSLAFWGIIWATEFGAWEGSAKKREGREWCRRMEGMDGEPQSADKGPCKIPLFKSPGKILSGRIVRCRSIAGCSEKIMESGWGLPGRPGEHWGSFGLGLQDRKTECGRELLMGDEREKSKRTPRFFWLLGGWLCLFLRDGAGGRFSHKWRDGTLAVLSRKSFGDVW